MSRSRIPTVALLLLAAAGPAAAAPAAFVRRHGGLMEGPVPYRVIRALAGLRALPGFGHLTVAVLASDEVGAYAWPSGELYLTRGLVHLADDGALAAALAHEAAHLLDGGHAGGAAALAGRRHDGDRESRADAIGCDLLRRQGRDPAGLVRLLKTLEDQALAQAEPTAIPAARVARAARSCAEAP